MELTRSSGNPLSIARKSKKAGLVFSVGLLIMVVAALIYAYVQLNYKYKTFEKSVGEKQYELIATYQEAEKILLYLDQSAYYSLRQSAYDLASYGGIGEPYIQDDDLKQPGKSGGMDEECGKYMGYNVWYSVKKDGNGGLAASSCFDESKLRPYLEDHFTKRLSEYILNNPYDIPMDNYRYELRDNLEILGHPYYPLKIYISKKAQKEKFFDGLMPEEFTVPRTDVKTTKFIDFSDIRFAETEDGRKIDFSGVCPKGKKCMLTKEAFDLLVRAEDIASKKGRCLKVNSAYRSYEQQKTIWQANAIKYPDPAVRRKYVADPDNCGNFCPHLTGNAIDVTFCGRTTQAMSSQDWQLLKDILNSVTDGAGQPQWIKYSAEPWHFECCGTERFNRAQELAKTSGKRVTEIS